ncbi:sigma-70 family RNA polymerase sigma factor [Nannocystis pusilla]|uniref:Sigma-70 family RNA polymerase sigma factor n=1 Tax=Nannocystis pusilla TaxID=889268 RepID=A0A9X3EKB7_9BACT|nr:sigma-70 family RNA polymerase sigma factor [Nannocystis pusilla]
MEADIELLEAWRAGDVRAGDALLRRYFEALHRFFAHKVDDEVDDLIQRTFLALVRSRQAIREAASFRAYVFTVARNELYHYLGARRRTREALDFGSVSVADLGTSPSGAFARRKEQAALLRGLRAIPVELQVALELHYWEGLTTAELANVLGVPQGTAKSMLRRAREQLEARLRRDAGAGVEATLGELEAWARSIRDVARPGRS